MSSDALLSLEGVSVRFGDKVAARDVTFAVRAGERFALVGESGSGKTVTALSITRLIREARVEGRIVFNGEELTSKSERELRAIRGAEIAMIFQEPMSALNPLYTIGDQILETLVLHGRLTPGQGRRRAVELLGRTGLRDPERRYHSYPHQLSGGQRQRAMIAMALACRPKLLIADEPTTALDVTIRGRILSLLMDLQAEERALREEGMAILLITHDLHLVRRFAERVAVMEAGRLVEVGDAVTLFESPQHSYTRALLASAPVREIAPHDGNERVLLRARGLRVDYPKRLPGVRGWFRKGRFTAVSNLALELRAGETVGVVGESGSGKSTLAQAIMGLVRTTSGSLEVDGHDLGPLSARQRRVRRSCIQVVFQDPYGSLSPRRTVEEIVAEGLDLHRPGLTRQARRERVVSALAEVGLPDARLASYPHELSGGQRQRVAIARALIVEPKVVVLDEPTSALDLSVQRQVLQLLVRLQRKHGLAYLLISHDLAVVAALAHRILVMKDGEVVESGETTAVMTHPQHDHTRRFVEESSLSPPRLAAAC